MAKELYGDENQIFVRYFKLFELKKNRLIFSSFWGKIYSNSVVSFVGKSNLDLCWTVIINKGVLQSESKNRVFHYFNSIRHISGFCYHSQSKTVDMFLDNDIYHLFNT